MYDVVPGHVDGQIIGEEEICSKDGLSDVSCVELMGEGAALAEEEGNVFLPCVLMREPLAAMKHSHRGLDFLSMEEAQRTEKLASQSTR